MNEHQTKAVPRFPIKYTASREDGSQRVVLKRGLMTRRDAAAALRAQVRRVELGEGVDASKQRHDAYLAEWIDTRRLWYWSLLFVQSKSGSCNRTA